MKFKIFPDPGKLPTRPPPMVGEKIAISLLGLPPRKQKHRSCRNPNHPQYSCFVRLREAAIKAVAGRQWFLGAIRLDFVMFGPEPLGWGLVNEYLGGIMDSLDGSHGPNFTYLPIVYQDDAQVAAGSSLFRQATEYCYTLEIEFLELECVIHSELPFDSVDASA